MPDNTQLNQSPQLKQAAKFILRIDDVGWLPPHKTKDVGLKYFREWREALGSIGAPVYYGAIPTCLGQTELYWLRDALRGGEELAVHGYSHARGEIVTGEMMRHAASTFSLVAKCQTYIAPFNGYTPATVRDWGEACPGSYFLGGFFPQDHNHCSFPIAIGNTIHIPAYRPLYDHTEPLIENLQKYLDDQRRSHNEGHSDSSESPPVVVTLHATWGYNSLGRLRAVMDLIRPHLVPIQSALDWLKLAGS